MTSPAPELLYTEFNVYDIITAILSLCSLVGLIFVVVKKRVYKSCSSFLMFLAMCLASIQLFIMSILHLSSFFTTTESAYDARYINNIMFSFLYAFVNSILLLQWSQVYQLLKNPERAKENIVQNRVRNAQILLVGSLLLAAAFCLSIAIL